MEDPVLEWLAARCVDGIVDSTRAQAGREDAAERTFAQLFMFLC